MLVPGSILTLFALRSHRLHFPLQAWGSALPMRFHRRSLSLQALRAALSVLTLWSQLLLQPKLIPSMLWGVPRVTPRPRRREGFARGFSFVQECSDQLLIHGEG